MFELFGFSF